MGVPIEKISLEAWDTFYMRPIKMGFDTFTEVDF